MDLKRNDDVRPDILDDSRIHPEDYEYAFVICRNAMDLDEEDLDESASAVVQLRATNFVKLRDVKLSDYAKQILISDGVRKLFTLKQIIVELKNPFCEKRNPFKVPDVGEVFEMLTGETLTTLNTGLIVPVRVLRVRNDNVVLVRLESGIEGSVAAEYRSDPGSIEVGQLRPGVTVRALVISLDTAQFMVELSTQPSQLAAGDFDRRRVTSDPYYDVASAREEAEGRRAVKTNTGGRQRRLIKHPDFRNMSGGEAELFLSTQQPGDCVIRPSSKENHVAVTWKVDAGVYQHIGQSCRPRNLSRPFSQLMPVPPLFRLSCPGG